MLKNSKNIFETPPILFAEDVYLCNEFGDILTGRFKTQRKIKNIFKIMGTHNVRFIRDNMALPGFRPLIFVDTPEGLAIFDLSLCPKFGLVILIFPDFSREEMLALLSTNLAQRSTISPEIKIEAVNYKGYPIEDKALIFKDRLLEVRRSGEYFTYLLKSNSQVVDTMLDIINSLGRFYGCDIHITLDNIYDNFEPKNSFCFESFAFSLISLIFLARNYSDTRGATIKIHVDEMGFYFDFGFRIAKQYGGEQISNIAPELKHLLKKAEFRIFNCITYQKDGTFILRAFPWLRTPDSADLKERMEDFIYDC